MATDPGFIGLLLFLQEGPPSGHRPGIIFGPDSSREPYDSIDRRMLPQYRELVERGYATEDEHWPGHARYRITPLGERVAARVRRMRKAMRQEATR